MEKSSKSSSRNASRANPFLVEEGGPGWSRGVAASCAVVTGANRKGGDSLEARRYQGMMRLLGRVFEGVKGGGKKKVQGDAEQDGSVENRPRLSDGKKADYPRKAIVG